TSTCTPTTTWFKPMRGRAGSCSPATCCWSRSSARWFSSSKLATRPPLAQRPFTPPDPNRPSVRHRERLHRLESERTRCLLHLLACDRPPIRGRVAGDERVLGLRQEELTAIRGNGIAVDKRP